MLPLSSMKKEQTGTKMCPSCDKEISAKAKRCPYCRQDLRGWFRRHPILTFFGILFCFIAIAMYGNNTTSSGDGKESQTTFVASVNFNNGEFIISNLDKSTCENARMKVNDEYTLEGYKLDSGLDSAAKTGQATVYKVGAGQFTKGDGTRFNPFLTKPKNFSIGCRGNNELTNAFWYGEFSN